MNKKTCFCFLKACFYQLLIIKMIFECLFNTLKNYFFTGVMRYSVSTESLNYFTFEKEIAIS